MHPGMKAALQKHNVDAASIKRARPFLETTDNFDKLSRTVREVTCYLAGTEPLPKELPPELHDRADALLETASAPLKWGDWEHRILDVITQPPVWGDDGRPLWHWLRDHVEKEPAAPVLESVLAALDAHGVKQDDPKLLGWILYRMRTVTTEKGELTSSGRWIIARAEEDLGRVVKAARAAKAMETLHEALVKHRWDFFVAHRRELEPRNDYEQCDFIRLLLERSPREHEQEVVERARKLKAGREAWHVAKDLVTHFGARHQELTLGLLVRAEKAMMKKDVISYEDGYAGNLSLRIVKLALETFGAAGFVVSDLYENDNEAERLGLYALMAKAAGAEAVSRLVDGLLLPKGETNYGVPPVTHARYVDQLLKLLEPYDLAPHRERILATLGKVEDRKVQALVARKFGLAGAKDARKVVEPKGKPVDAEKAYRFEDYIAELEISVLAGVLKKKKLPVLKDVFLAQRQGASCSRRCCSRARTAKRSR